jgi:hypothetical protein
MIVQVRVRPRGLSEGRRKHQCHRQSDGPAHSSASVRVRPHAGQGSGHRLPDIGVAPFSTTAVVAMPHFRSLALHDVADAPGRDGLRNPGPHPAGSGTSVHQTSP